MQTYYYSTILGQVYGGGAYDTSTYEGGTANGSSGNGALTDTGIAVAGIVTIAAVILLTAIVVRIWKRPRRQAALAPIETDDDMEAVDNDPQDTVSR